MPARTRLAGLSPAESIPRRRPKRDPRREKMMMGITDRKKDMFIVGGFNAYPAEIENTLLGHPKIAQAAVVGVPDERLGEVGMAFLVARASEEVEPGELISWARDRMANYKVPRYVQMVDVLPLNASGKVLKYELRARAASSVAPVDDPK